VRIDFMMETGQCPQTLDFRIMFEEEQGRLGTFGAH
jgi:hypothetical protein